MTDDETRELEAVCANLMVIAENAPLVGRHTWAGAAFAGRQAIRALATKLLPPPAIPRDPAAV